MTAEQLLKFEVALSRSSDETSDYDLNQDIVLPEGRKLRDAAVLIPLHTSEDGLNVMLTKRSSALKHHPGQIAFPGGKRDGTESLEDAALREAQEEVGLPKNSVRVLGSLPSHETVTGFQVRPFVGFIEEEFEPIAEAGEVSEVFEVPLDFLIDPKNFQVQSRRWRGQQRFYYTVPYGPYYIWGATARMLRSMAERFS